ncbi:trimethylamine--corrinoid methyltransferase [haloarchaeon 3A1-DGR]|nr:trimethylamine--corrinoid methyltransferase [haloarchaeon 3A1-DGR]
MSRFKTGPSAGMSIDPFGEAGIEAVHEASIRVLEELGVQLDHERARAVLRDHGATVDADDVVRIPGDLVAEAVDRAPASFTLHARNPDNDVVVGGEGPPVRAPGYGPATIHTAADGRRDARLADYERLTRLAQATDVITCAGYHLCQPADIERSDRHLAMLERSLTLSDKPVLGPTYGAERAREGLELVGIATDDPDLSRPVVAGLINTVPPRRIGTEMLAGLLAYADRRQPLVVSSFTMAGASGPPTLAAAMAQANAENLAAITLAQLVAPGTPVVYGVPSAVVDDRYGSLSIGGPESALFAAFAGRMAAHYGLPSRGGGSLSDAKRVDHQSGFESTLVGTATALGGVDFVLNAAGVLESYSAVSPEKFVLDCETLRAVDRLRDGIRVDAETLSLDRLAAVEPGGHFLEDLEPESATDPQFHRSAVVDKRSHEAWADDGARSAFESATDRVRELQESYDRPPMDEGIAREVAAYVDERTDLDPIAASGDEGTGR